MDSGVFCVMIWVTDSLQFEVHFNYILVSSINQVNVD